MNSENEQKNLFLKSDSFEKGFFHSQGTYVHPTAIIGTEVELDENVKIGPYCTLVGKVSIGSGTRLHGYVTIGMPAQDVNTMAPIGSVEIGKNNEIREFVTISSPKIAENKTIIGNNCYIMNFSHIAHDVIIEDHVVLINNVNLGGHVHVGHHAMLMANSAIHQFCKVGAYSALAPFSGMRQDLPPFCLFDGKPGRFAGLNVVGLRRSGMTAPERNGIKTITKLFFQDKMTFERLKDHVAEHGELQTNGQVQAFLQFIEKSSRGIPRKTIAD